MATVTRPSVAWTRKTDPARIPQSDRVHTTTMRVERDDRTRHTAGAAAAPRRSNRRDDANNGMMEVRRVAAASGGQLGRVAVRALAEAQGRAPLIISGTTTRADLDLLATAWSDFVETDDETYCTNQGCPSDGPDGSCNHGYCTLAEVWRQPWRIETELSTKSRPKKRPRSAKGSNPISKFMRTERYSQAAAGFAQLQRQLHDFAVTTAGSGCAVVRPAFITGAIARGIGSGGVPCNTHRDAYHNIVLVLTGRKVFYIARPETFENEADWRRGGDENERLLARPLDGTAKDVPADWFRAELRPGDMLYLPLDWWHAVLSDPHTVMTNVWTQRVTRHATRGAAVAAQNIEDKQK